MALMTENINLQSALLKHLSGIQDIEILDQIKVSSIERDHREGGHWPTVHLSDGRTFRTRLLVIQRQDIAYSQLNMPHRSELMASIHLFELSPESHRMDGPMTRKPSSQRCLISLGLHSRSPTMSHISDFFQQGQSRFSRSLRLNLLSCGLRSLKLHGPCLRCNPLSYRA